MISILSKENRRYFKTKPTTPIVNNDLCQCTHPDKDYSFFFFFSSPSNNFSSLFRGNRRGYRVVRQFQILSFIRAFRFISRVGGMI